MYHAGLLWTVYANHVQQTAWLPAPACVHHAAMQRWQMLQPATQMKTAAAALLLMPVQPLQHILQQQAQVGTLLSLQAVLCVVLVSARAAKGGTLAGAAACMLGSAMLMPLLQGHGLLDAQPRSSTRATSAIARCCSKALYSCSSS
ncbi:hypothetical protein ABBQ38_003007 [Trebouxia sp. C0009 RCD-2024]